MCKMSFKFTLMTRRGLLGLAGSRYEMCPASETEIMCWPCHRHDTCWSSIAVPIGNSVMSFMPATSQVLHVLSPDAVSKLLLSGLHDTA